MDFKRKRKGKFLPDFPLPPTANESNSLILYRNPDREEDKIEVKWMLNAHLRPYQRKGVRFLFQRCFARNESAGGSPRIGTGAILADDMGLGKTIQIIALMSAVLEKSQMLSKDEDECRYLQFGDGSVNATFLIICPASVLENWADEMDIWGRFVYKKFHGSSKEKEICLKYVKCGKLEICLTTFETARDSIEDLNSVNWDCVVIDEVHKIKEASSKVTKALKRLKCRSRIGLTGTPLQNKYEELWCIFDWANPGCLGTLHQFQYKYARKIQAGLRIDATKGELAKSRQLQKELDDIKAEFLLRRTKNKVIKVVFTFLHLFLKASNHVALLKNVENESELSGQSYCEEALRQIGDDFHTFLHMSDPRFSGKMQVLQDLLSHFHDNSASNNKVLLFSYSTSLLDILESFVESRGYEYRRLDGKTRIDARAKIVREFNENIDIFLFLISTKAGGLGLNITGANIVIIFDPNWNPSHDIQAQDRAYRIGQTRDVNVYRLITVGSIEENIYLRQVYKQQLGKNAVDGENARRYFKAVQGQTKGELFGVKNLFSFRKHQNSSGNCLTSDILNRHDQVERIVMGQRHVIQLGNDMLSHDEQPENDVSSPQNNDFVQEIVTEEEEGVNQSNLDQILRSGGIVYHHENQECIGGSKVEDHLSEFAQRRMNLVDREEGSSQELVLENCETFDPDRDTLQPSPPESDEETDQVAPCTQLLRTKPPSSGHPDGRAILSANQERIFRSEQVTYFYGQTPSKRREMDFQKLSNYLEKSIEETVEFVLELSDMEKVDLLKEFYESLDFSGVGDIYDKIRRETILEQQDLDDFRQENRIPEEDLLSDGPILEPHRNVRKRKKSFQNLKQIDSVLESPKKKLKNAQDKPESPDESGINISKALNEKERDSENIPTNLDSSSSTKNVNQDDIDGSSEDENAFFSRKVKPAPDVVAFKCMPVRARKECQSPDGSDEDSNFSFFDRKVKPAPEETYRNRRYPQASTSRNVQDPSKLPSSDDEIVEVIKPAPEETYKKRYYPQASTSRSRNVQDPSKSPSSDDEIVEVIKPAPEETYKKRYYPQASTSRSRKVQDPSKSPSSDDEIVEVIKPAPEQPYKKRYYPQTSMSRNVLELSREQSSQEEKEIVKPTPAGCYNVNTGELSAFADNSKSYYEKLLTDSKDDQNFSAESTQTVGNESYQFYSQILSRDNNIDKKKKVTFE